MADPAPVDAMRITSWNCLCRDVSRRLSDLAPLRSDLITLQECRRTLGVPVFGGVGPPVAACATIAGAVEEGVWLPSARARGECVLPVHVDRRRLSSGTQFIGATA